jgi:hypothetical protein
MSGVSVNVSGNAGAAVTVLDGLQRKAESTAEKIANGFKQRIGQRLFDGLIQAANSLPNAIRAAIDAGGRLSDQMARTGASGENLVVMERVLKNAGMAGESTTRLLGLMQRSLAGVNEDMQTTSEAFAVLGVDMGRLREMDPVDAFQALGKAIMAVQDPAERTALAMRIFGRTGAEALVAFSDVEGFETARRELGALPATLAQNASQLDAVSDRLGNLGTGWQQIGASAAVAILPALEKITAQFATMDLTAVGKAIGGLVNGLVAIAPHLVAIGAGMAALKIATFLGLMANKTREWWTQTAAIKANTAALRENATAGATAGKGPSRAGMIGGGAALVVAGIGAQLAMNYANDLAEANAAMQESYDRGNAAMEKFHVGAIQAQVASRAEIEQTIASIESEKAAIEDAAMAQMQRTDDADTRERIMADTQTTTRLLDLKTKALRATTDQQLAANAAARAAAEAEAAAAKATEEAAKAYATKRAEFDRRIKEADEQFSGTGSAAAQLAELARAEAAIRAKITTTASTGSAGDIIGRLDQLDDSTGKTADLEQALKLEAIEKRRADLQTRLADEKEKIRQSKAAALADWEEEMRILNAQLAGNQEKVKALEREAEIRAEIARLTAAGFSAQDARTGAERLVDARARADAAQKEAEAEERRQEARQRSQGLIADAAATMAGPDAVAARQQEKRAQEIAGESGLGIDEARNIAANEADLEKLTSLRNRADNMQFQSSIGRASDMQRIGGGGGVVSSGLDIARQQTDLQQQMVTLLSHILARSPETPISDY